MVQTTPFDLVVIGAGPGGYVAAIRAAQLGMRVACIDKQALGGTCLNIGCIPSKALLDSSELFYQTQTTFARHGIRTAQVELDLPAMMARKDEVVQVLQRGIAGLLRRHRVETIQGAARLRSPTAIDVQHDTGTTTLSTRRVLIATGSAPVALPGLPFDGTYILSSTEALALTTVPKRLVVIGAGAIGLELGSVWSRLGSDVMIVELMDHILPGLERDLTARLQRLLEAQGLRFRLRSTTESADLRDGVVHLTLATHAEPEHVTCDRVLVAVGRRPYTEGLGVRDVGISLDAKGRIVVDAKFETSVPGVYAIGDVIAGPMLAHKATEEGIAAVEGMAGRMGHVNYGAIPYVVYTHPELASVGCTEAEARHQERTVRVGTFPLAANGRARCLEATEGYVKIIGEATSDRVLGLHILAARASDLITEGALAIEFAASVEDLALAVHAHPSLPETIKEAALAATGRALHV